MALNYAEVWSPDLLEIMEQESLISPFITTAVKWLSAKTFHFTQMSTSGYKAHSRSGGWNKGTFNQADVPFTLSHDRDIQFLVDKADVDETNQTASIKNISEVFHKTQQVPELDAYFFSKVATEAQKLEITAYSEKTHKGLLRHIVYRISSDLNQILIIFVINSNNIDKKLTALSKSIIEKFPVVSGVCANLNVQKSNVIMSNNTKNIIGTDYYIEKLSEVNYKISANSFFQVNPLCAELIFNKVKELILSKITNPTILDAYSGVSSFGIWLSSIASKVVCIEEVKSASEDARANVKLNKIDNIKIINGDAEVEFDKLIKKGIKFDISITDPPRKGCSLNSINNLIKITEKFIIYVSCNVSTLARDMKILNENGFKAIYIQPVDMFPNTYHVETIVMFERI